MTKARTVLVTGAAGFAGGYLLERLAGRCDLFAWARSEPPSETARLARWTSIELNDRERVRHEIRALRPDAVFHCAGASHVGASWQNTARPLAANVLVTHYLLDALRRTERPCRLLVTGSAAVYAPSAAPLETRASRSAYSGCAGKRSAGRSRRTAAGGAEARAQAARAT